MYKFTKRIIFLFFANILLCSAIYAQTEWFPINAEWYYEHNSLGEYSTLRFLIEKDTIVNEQNCKLVRGMHNDEIVYEKDGNVYYYFNNDFRKIYAFDVNIDDIIEFEFKTMKNIASSDLDTTIILPCRIENISTITIDGMELRKISAFYEYHENNVHGMHDDFSHEYIEKVGVEDSHIMKGILPVMPNFATITEGHYKMRCYNDFQINYTTDWWQSAGGGKPCDYTASINKENDIANIKVYPNPTSGQLGVETRVRTSEKIELFDVFGRKVFETRETNFDISHLPAGLYILQIKTEQRITRKKIVKQ